MSSENIVEFRKPLNRTKLFLSTNQIVFLTGIILLFIGLSISMYKFLHRLSEISIRNEDKNYYYYIIYFFLFISFLHIFILVYFFLFRKPSDRFISKTQRNIIISIGVIKLATFLLLDMQILSKKKIDNYNIEESKFFTNFGVFIDIFVITIAFLGFYVMKTKLEVSNKAYEFIEDYNTLP